MNTPELQTASERSSPGRLKYRWRTRLIILLLLGIVLGAVAVSIQISKWPEAKRLQATRDSFMLTGCSLDHYDELHGHLPPATRRQTIGKPTDAWQPNGTGKPLYSWRAEVAQYRDNWCQEPFDSSASWDSLANRRFADFPWQFCYDALVTWDSPQGYSKITSQMAITGPGTGFGCDGDPPRRLTDIPENTLLLVEVRNSGVHWMQPGDLNIRTMPHTVNAADGRGISSRHPGGFHVMFADFTTWFLSDKVPFDAIAKFFTIEGGKQNDREAILGPYVLWRTEERRPLSAYYSPDHAGRLILDRRVSDADLAELQLPQFADTKDLWLRNTQVAGPGLAHLRRLVHLETLLLEGTPLTDEGLAHLAGMRQLRWLRINNTQITDQGLTHLKALVNLRGLELAGTRVTDAGLQHLEGHTQLEWLELSGTQVTDTGLECLRGMNQLRHLFLDGTKVTATGVKGLQQRLPKCHIPSASPTAPAR